MSSRLLILTLSISLTWAVAKPELESPEFAAAAAADENEEILGEAGFRTRNGTRATPEATRQRRDTRRRHRHPGGFVINATELTAEDERFVTDVHNRKRAHVKPPAADMLELVYDRGLADLAKAYSRKCVYEHSSHLHTGKFSWPGENLYISTKVFRDLSKALARAAFLWYHEKLFYSWAKRLGLKRHAVGHYTEMVWASNYAIGCGATTCGNVYFRGRVHKRVQLVVCHYGPGGNYRGEHPYLAGKPCSHCPPHKKCVCESASLHHR